MKRAGALVFMLLSVGLATADQGLVVESAEHQQMLIVAEQLRCAVCQNQSVAESNSGLAQDMRLVISEQLDEGQSEQQVLDYFVARYGDYILMKPRSDGRNTFLWWFPVVFLLLIPGAIYGYFRGRGRQISSPEPLSAEEQAAIARARQELDE